MTARAQNSSAREIFTAATKLSDEASRREFLQGACGSDHALRKKVEALLKAGEQHKTNPLEVAVNNFGGASEPSCITFEMVVNDSALLSADRVDVESIQNEFGFGHPPQHVGRFRICELVGHGGMGFVYQGYDEELSRLVALKFPRIEMVGHRAGRERFIREAKLAAQLDHPNLVKIYDIGAADSRCYIASQWCDGGNLAEYLQQNPGRQPARWSAGMVASLARAVAYCHQQRIVHLDIKPANIMMVPGPDDEHRADDVVGGDPRTVIPMLTDFGIARVIEESLTVTESSVLIGTPLYMAPEQANCQRDAIGPASDVYSLGVILYELVFGERPYHGESAMQVLDRVRAEETIRLPDVSAVPTDLKTICQRCLEHSHESRYPTADALAEDLDRYLRGEAIHAQPIRWWHRFGRWCRQPARVFQAGLVSVPIQAALLLNFAGVVIGLYQGVFDNSVDPQATSLDIAKVAFGAHLPQLVLAWLSFRHVRWSVIPGFLMSLITVFVLAEVLITGGSPITFYDDYPAARFLMHLLILVIMTIQTMAYLVAIPAALGRRNPSL